MANNATTLDDTVHRLTRKGQELQVRVMEVVGGGECGHVLVFGAIADGCLVRVHSRCLYGEALDSQDCDCRPELDQALDLIWAERSGVLVYLEQEGRGLGLISKALGYHESELRGIDTFSSYESLGFPADARTYLHAGKSLQALGLTSVRLLTNNPAKVSELRSTGLKVTRVPLHTRPLSKRAAAYLDAKRRQRDHLLPKYDVCWELDTPHVRARDGRIQRIWSRFGWILPTRRRAPRPEGRASK